MELFNPRERFSSDQLMARPTRHPERFYAKADWFVGQTKDDLAEVLRFSISVETAAERLRQRLAHRRDFNIDSAFLA